jgi:hypothetical protein
VSVFVSALTLPCFFADAFALVSLDVSAFADVLPAFTSALFEPDPDVAASAPLADTALVASAAVLVTAPSPTAGFASGSSDFFFADWPSPSFSAAGVTLAVPSVASEALAATFAVELATPDTPSFASPAAFDATAPVVLSTPWVPSFASCFDFFSALRASYSAFVAS